MTSATFEENALIPISAVVGKIHHDIIKKTPLDIDNKLKY
jgi:hypothetical protein